MTETSNKQLTKRARRKAFTLNFILVEDRGDEIVRELARREIEKVLDKYGAVSDNLDDILKIPDREE